MRSGREDLNLRPQRPERCALTGLRYSPHRSKIPEGRYAGNSFLTTLIRGRDVWRSRVAMGK
jgi:hypothetical protein